MHNMILFVHEEERSRSQILFYRTSRVNFASTDADVSSTSYTILNVVRWGTVWNGICISYDVAGQLFMPRGLCTCILSSKREFIGINVYDRSASTFPLSNHVSQNVEWCNFSLDRNGHIRCQTFIAAIQTIYLCIVKVFEYSNVA